MTRNPNAHRADFTVRCACGEVFHTTDAHVGKQLPCRCGRTVRIQRPPAEYADAPKQNAPPQNAPPQNAPRQKTQRKQTQRKKSRRTTRIIRAAADRALTAPIAFLFRALQDMQSPRFFARWTARVSWAWFVSMVITWILLVTTSEHFLPATILAYGPRFLLLLPFIVLVPLAALASRRSLFPALCAMALVLGPIMGARVSHHTFGRSLPTAPDSGVIRVVTFNTQSGRLVAPQLREFVESYHPDVLAFQECGDELFDAMQALPTWHSTRHANLCTASRWPIGFTDSMPRADLARIATYGYGGTGLVVRYMIETPYGTLALVNLHLETARKGLQALTSGGGLVPDELSVTGVREMVNRSGNVDRVNLNAQIRDRESERASVWALKGDKQMPVIVVGDFNLPVESTIFRQHWGGFTDAFEKSGTGFGWSKREGRLLRIRIDHVLGNDAAPKPVGTWLGPDLGSDHLMVVADLRWPRG